MKKETVLITGGAGYIGSHAVKLFLKKGYSVIIFDNFCRGYSDPIKILRKIGNLKFIKGDLRNRNEIRKVFGNNKIDTVIHFAALCSVNESMEQPELYFENNVIGSFNLLEVMREMGMKNIIFSSTCAVYGEAKYLPVDEFHIQKPENPYGESKLMVEKMLDWYGRIHKFKFVILRYFNVCGADKEGIIGDSKKPSQLLMQNAVRGAMGIEPFFYTCPTVDTYDGTPIRDYIDVEDLVAAHHSAFLYLQKGGTNKILNLGNGRGYSVKEIVSEVERVFETKIQKKKTKPRKGEYAKIFSNPKTAQKILKWKAQKGISESIQSLRKWYEKFPDGYKK